MPKEILGYIFDNLSQAGELLRKAHVLIRGSSYSEEFPEWEYEVADAAGKVAALLVEVKSKLEV